MAAHDRVPQAPWSIFAVIPVHNRIGQTLRCLKALAASTVAAVAVVVDDGSSDGT
jgi:GT2 family glycosyltransferase